MSDVFLILLVTLMRKKRQCPSSTAITSSTTEPGITITSQSIEPATTVSQCAKICFSKTNVFSFNAKGGCDGEGTECICEHDTCQRESHSHYCFYNIGSDNG